MEYKLDPKWCSEILSNPVEVSLNDLESIKRACSEKGIVDKELPKLIKPLTPNKRHSAGEEDIIKLSGYRNHQIILGINN